MCSLRQQPASAVESAIGGPSGPAPLGRRRPIRRGGTRSYPKTPSAAPRSGRLGPPSHRPPRFARAHPPPPLARPACRAPPAAPAHPEGACSPRTSSSPAVAAPRLLLPQMPGGNVSPRCWHHHPPAVSLVQRRRQQEWQWRRETRPQSRRQCRRRRQGHRCRLRPRRRQLCPCPCCHRHHRRRHSFRHRSANAPTRPAPLPFPASPRPATWPLSGHQAEARPADGTASRRMTCPRPSPSPWRAASIAR
mmetsp:Transcript_10144/g.30246  ORF Transcript_10144/g.30246 Transcript_10144/m.30246 type:complete len:249 (-) Transcript_10144:86-832(-)